MTWSHSRTRAAVACSLLLTAAGCVTRKETITIAADRTVTIELEYEGDPKALDEGDAMPSARAGWDVTRTVDKEGEEETHVLTARRVFAPNKDLPRSFAPEGDPDADLYLDFPTALRTERREDGLYYHFRRLYTPRRWAYVRHWADMRDDAVEDLAEKPVEEMTQEERIRIAKAVAGVEAYRLIEFAREAARNAEPQLPMDHWLVARRAILNVYEEIDWNGLVDQYMALPKEAGDEHLERSTERIRETAYEGMLRSLRTVAELDDARLARFERAFDRAKHYFDITSSLGGHRFEIRLKMPGRVVAHNADRLDDNGEAFWEFEGNAFRDRPFELLVTSRVRAEPSAD